MADILAAGIEKREAQRPIDGVQVHTGIERGGEQASSEGSRKQYRGRHDQGGQDMVKSGAPAMAMRQEDAEPRFKILGQSWHGGIAHRYLRRIQGPWRARIIGGLCQSR